MRTAAATPASHGRCAHQATAALTVSTSHCDGPGSLVPVGGVGDSRGVGEGPRRTVEAFMGCLSGQTQRGLERADGALQPSLWCDGVGDRSCAPGVWSVVVGEFQVTDTEAMLFFRRHGLETDPVGARQEQT